MTRLETLNKENQQLKEDIKTKNEQLYELAERVGKFEKESQERHFREMSTFHLAKYMADLIGAVLQIRRVKALKRHKQEQIDGEVVEMFGTDEYPEGIAKPKWWLEEEILGLDHVFFQAISNIEEIRANLKAYMPEEEANERIESVLKEYDVDVNTKV